MSTQALRERPTRRWISVLLPSGPPLEVERDTRTEVDLGSMAYSAVTQPRPVPRRKGGTFSSTVAVQSTLVSPKEASTDLRHSG